MDPNGLLASRLYGAGNPIKAKAAEAKPSADLATSAIEPTPPNDFFDTVRNAADDLTSTVSAAETQSQKLIAGSADPHSVIEALAAAELAVETAVTVRDRVVEAYQEILRMQI